MAAMSDYLENKLIDFVFRGQAYSAPTTIYVGLLTTGTSDANTGQVEVTGGSYARVAVTSSLANWAGTQAAASTVASTGTSGTTSNNGVITSFGMYDAATGGNLLFYGNLSTSKTVNNGDAAPTFAAAALSIQLDN